MELLSLALYFFVVFYNHHPSYVSSVPYPHCGQTQGIAKMAITGHSEMRTMIPFPYHDMS